MRIDGAPVDKEKMAPNPSSIHPRSLLLPLFLSFVGFYLLTSGGRARVMDEYMVFFQTQSLAGAGSLAVPQAEQLGAWYGRAGLDGRPYVPYGPAHSLLLVPGYALGVGIARLPGVPADARDLCSVLGVVMMNALLAAALVVLFYLFLSRLGASLPLALAGAVAVGVSTPLWSYAGTIFSEVLTALLLLAALFAVERGSRERIDLGPLAAAGGLLALAILVRPVHAVAALCFGLALLAAPDRRARRLLGFVTIGATASLGLFVTLGLNASHYGDFLEFGYPDRVEGGKALNSFHGSPWAGLLGFLLSPGKSIFLFAPLLIPALLGWGAAWRSQRTLFVAALGSASAYLLLYAHYTQWEGGYCYGPRYLLPVLPLLLLGLGPFLRRARPRTLRVCMTLAVVGLLVELPGVLTSFLEEQVGGAAYYSADFDYRLSHNPWLGQGRLLGHYLGIAMNGDLASVPLGRGLDLWWLYLHRGGVGWGPIAALLALQLSLFGVGGAVLVKRLRSAKGPADLELGPGSDGIDELADRPPAATPEHPVTTGV